MTRARRRPAVVLAAVLATAGLAWVGPAAAPVAAEEGVDTPIEVYDAETTPDPEGPVATSGRTTITIQDRQLDLRATQRVASRGADGAEQTVSITSVLVDIPVCPDASGTIEGTFQVDQTLGGQVITASARLVGHVNDDAELAGFDLLDFQVQSSSSGEEPFLVVAGSSTGMDAERISSGELRGRVVHVAEDVRVDPFAHLGYVATLGWQFGRSALNAAVRHLDRGLCVRIEADTHGVTTLGAGQSTDIDIRVVDAVTGDVLELPAMSYPSEGTTEPGQVRRVPTPETWRYTAPDEELPSYRVMFRTLSRRGEHRVHIEFTKGWAFEGATLVQTGEGFTGVSTWSGFVCGDPFSTPWTFTQVVDAGAVRHEQTFQHVPISTFAPRPDIGTVPMIEPVVLPRPDEPSFQLYLDDIAPEEVSPATQRIPVEVRPVTTECSGGAGTG